MTTLPDLKENSALPAENASRTTPTGPIMVSEKSAVDVSDQEFAQISKILLFNRDFKLDAYKDKCIRRRIAIRIRANHCVSVQDYCDLLIADKHEIDHLLKVLTIHVSQFFRNFSTFEKLRAEIIPHLFADARQQGKKSLRFLSLGCSSGEEPYSLALILAEHFPREILEIPVTIDATDVDTGILETAAKATYNHDRLLETPINYITKYFSEEGLQYKLSPSITKMVNFSNSDMFNNLIYRSCDLILCRNVMIYFAREQQEKVLANIARSLGKHGFLVLGKSETILGTSRTHFQTVCPVERIYRSLSSS
jgi:chemotaxis protein methyltransferase CheR